MIKKKRGYLLLEFWLSFVSALCKLFFPISRSRNISALELTCKQSHKKHYAAVEHRSIVSTRISRRFLTKGRERSSANLKLGLFFPFSSGRRRS